MKKYIILLCLATWLFSACDKRDGVIYGTLKYSEEVVVSNVEIQLYKCNKTLMGRESAIQIDQQLTKDNGTYYFQSLPAGQYELHYMDNYNKEKEIGVKLSASETRKIDLKY